MKKSLFLIAFIANGFFSMNAQVGIGTQDPDSSAALDVVSTSQGLLPPRMSQTDRDAIVLPAKGLIIYNTTTNSLDINNGTPEVKAWEGIAASGSGSSTSYFSASAGNDIRTVDTNYVIVPDMSIIPGAGTYEVSFNGQYNSAPFNYNVNITEQGKIDLLIVYNKLFNTPNTVLNHGNVFGSETLTAGVYSVQGATNIAGILTLDGQLNPNSVFIIKVNGGALTSSAGAKVILVNAASACNVFWVVEGAADFAAATEMKGLILGFNGKVTFAAGGSLIGRMFSTTGAIVTDSSTITIPNDCTYIDLGVLSTFVMYSSKGAVSNTAATHVTGDIGTNEGAITGHPGTGSHNGVIYTRSSPEVNIDKNVLSTFSVFQNGILVPHSTRIRRSKTPTFDVSLQAIATVLNGESIDIRWKTDASELQLVNRILTLVKVQ